MKHEEIEEYIKSRDLDVMQYQLVLDAMYYTEKTIIENACGWLKKHLYDYDRVEGYEVFRDVNSFVNDFCKAMGDK